MMPLRELQERFQARVLERSAGIESELNGVAEPDFAARLSVYSHGYHSRLIEALSTTYPVLKALMGDEEFEQTMHRFIDANPSPFYSVRYYGERVAEFIVHARSQPAVVVFGDLARWEWVLADVFDAPDDVPATLDVLAAVPPDGWSELSFKFRASTRRAVTNSNAVAWWRSIQNEDAAPGAFESGERVDWVLWRCGIKTMFRSFERLEARVFDAALAGATFGDLCELIAIDGEEGEAPLRAASILRTWFVNEILLDVTVAPPR